VHAVFCWGNLTEGSHFEYLGLDGRVIVNLVFKELDGSMGWDNLA